MVFAAIVTLMASLSSGNAQSFDHLKLAEQARRNFIVPSYERLQKRTQRLRADTVDLCKAPSSEHLSTVRDAYRDTIDAWGRVEMITFGPIAEQNRFERIFFWPDRKGIGSRQVRRLLASSGNDLITPGSLAKMSVAVQGLTALEVLLYGKGSSDLAVPVNGQHRCNFAAAVADNLTRIVGRILRSWSDDGRFTKIWNSPGETNPVYLKSSELTLELIKAFDQSLESVRNRRIVPALGLGRTRRKHRPILWRSKLSMVLIHANMLGAKSLFSNGGLAQAYIESQADKDKAHSTVTSIDSEFKIVLRATGPLAGMPDPFGRSDIKTRLIAVGFPLKSIRGQAVPLIKSAAGLTVGFNASDGD
ncbi:MAG: putative lipoprotein [Hyphomicrobiaceae bacterium]